MERTRAELAHLLAPAARSWGIALDPAVARLSTFAELLLEWGARINLTGARSVAELCAEHFADAFPLVPLLPRSGRWVDVGSGAGLPGIILAITRPDLAGVLLEPSQKRRAFLQAAIRTLGLVAVKVEADRLEDHVARVGASYDIAVSRAVFGLSDWLEAGRALVSAGGTVVGFGTEATVPKAPRDAEVTSYNVGAGTRMIVSVRK